MMTGTPLSEPDGSPTWEGRMRGHLSPEYEGRAVCCTLCSCARNDAGI